MTLGRAAIIKDRWYLSRRWRPAAHGEFQVAREVLRSRFARSLTFLAQVTFGLGLGCFACEFYIWARTATWGGPLLFEVYRALRLKLPHSGWTGLAQIINWMLVQPIALCAGALLMTLATMLRLMSIWIGQRRNRVIPQRLKPKLPLQPASPPLPAATDQLIQLIEEAYRKLDAAEKVSKSVPHSLEHQSDDVR